MQKAEAFNETFLESSRLENDPPEPDFIEMDNVPVIEDITITEQDVDDIIKSLDTSKSYGHDMISPRMLKEARPSVVPILTKLFNKSLNLGQFPSIWKKANVIPIYKKEEDFITTNYRPISLLSIISKVFEKIVFKYLYNFFKTNFLITVWQSGFIPGSSTVTQLVELYDQFCKAVDQGKEIRIVFLDISKAFDRVWHRGLVHKLKKTGIRGKLLAWIIDYLKDRQQRVLINGSSSGWGLLDLGVPQGSVLGPLLFLIFIDDIVYVIRHCKIRLFADDTCLFIEVEDSTEAAYLINEDLKKIQTWASKWLVTFSPPKTEEMVITTKTPRPHPDLKFGTEIIKRVTSHKHLGVILTNNLTWKEHVDSVVSRATKRLGILKSLKYKLDRRTLEIIYKSYIRPIMEYADIVWDCPVNNLNSLDRLENIQLNAARVVTGATRRCSREALYKDTGWEKLHERRSFHRLTLMFTIVYNTAPQYLRTLLPDLVSNRTNYNLRNRNAINIPFGRLETTRNSFFPTTTKFCCEHPILSLA